MFHSDKPISSRSDDLLKRSGFAQLLANTIASSVSKWIGSGISYEVSKDFEKYLTKDRILQAINNQKVNGNLYQLPIEIQYACAAFFMYATDSKIGHRGVTQEDVKETLAKWDEA